MAGAKRVQWRDVLAVAGLISAVALATFIDVVALLEPVGTDPKDGLISLSAVAPVVLWVVCTPLAYARHRARRDRIPWALGCALLWAHVAVAFHLGHGWSHRAAWDHTQAASGYGDGVFANYAFALVWAADAIWALVAFDAYRRRPGWLHWGIHGFLAFVVFNAAVVFASPDGRVWFGTFVLGMLAIALASRRVRPPKRARPVDAPPAG